jgi:hypothetical protein
MAAAFASRELFQIEPSTGRQAFIARSPIAITNSPATMAARDGRLAGTIAKAFLGRAGFMELHYTARLATKMTNYEIRMTNEVRDQMSEFSQNG